MSLTIHTLGAFQVEIDDVPLPPAAWKTRKNKALCKILLTHRRRPLAREQILEWLWPKLPPDRADRSLRVAVSQLRRTLEPELPSRVASTYILTTHSGYAWNAQAHCYLDADRFETLCTAFANQSTAPDSNERIALAEEAKALYRDDYLAEDRYADWATVERERLRERYFALLTRLAEAYARQGRYQRALALCREVLAADPCRESVWRQLMLYHYHSGDQARALQVYAECCETLRAEVGVEPLPETTELCAAIRAHRLTPSDAQAPYPTPARLERVKQMPLSWGRAPFVGREDEFGKLMALAETLPDGIGRFVVVEGEAGIGKTRLVEEALPWLERRGARVLTIRCHGEGDRPFEPLTEAMRHALREMPTLPEVAPVWLAAVAELLPELQDLHPDLPTVPPLPPDEAKLRLFEALSQLIHGLRSDHTPLVLFLDDIPWADPATLEFLGHWAPTLAHEPVLVLATLRSEDVADSRAEPLFHLLRTLRRRRLLTRIPLERLSPLACETLYRRLSGDQERDPPLARYLYRETEGNPLFLLAQLQSLFEEGLLVVDAAGRWQATVAGFFSVGVGAVPGTVQTLLSHRLARLSRDERQVLEAASVLGREFEWPLLAHMRAWRPDHLFDHLDRLVHVRLLREEAREGYVFGHDKIRQVVYDSIPSEHRTWLHRRAGEALEAHHDDRDPIAGQLAYHFHRAGESGKAFVYSVRAGRWAACVYANESALAHYRSALALADAARPDPDVLSELHERMGDLQEASGRYEEALQTLTQALALGGAPARRVRLLYKLAHCHDRLGRRGPAHRLLRQAVAEVERLGVEVVGPLEAARTFARWAILGLSEHSATEAECYANRAVELIAPRLPASSEGERRLSWEEYDAFHTVLINAGETFRHHSHWQRAGELFRLSLQLAEQYADASGIGYSCHNYGDVRLGLGDFSEARALYRRAAWLWRKAGQRWLEMAARTHLGIAWACEGEWAQATDAFAQARAVGEGIEPTEWLANTVLWRALAELRAGGASSVAQEREREARRRADEAGQPLNAALLALLHSAVAAAGGREASAARHLVEARTHLEQDAGAAFYCRWILRQFARADAD